MPDVQNFFHKALALFFANMFNIFTAEESFYRVLSYHFPAARSIYAEAHAHSIAIPIIGDPETAEQISF